MTSLSVVDPRSPIYDSGDPVADVLASESGQLSPDRARLALPSFALTTQNTPAVAQVCQGLDGIALAIELAAACRQQTLEATIRWSYRLLTEEGRRLLRRLAVFAGGWLLEAAEELEADLVPPRENVLEMLRRLVAKSLVLVNQPPEDQPSV